MPTYLNATAPDFSKDFAALLAKKREISIDVEATVRAIVQEVATRGDEAVLDYTRQFDRVAPSAVSDLRISKADIDAALAACKPTDLAALDLAASRIEAYHRRQLPLGFDEVDAAGVRLAMRWSPIASAGLYVPGGTASYPSSVLMNAIPAHVAGVKRMAMVVPAPDGLLNPLVLAAARRAGIEEIWRVGGAQAVAALAYGTDSIQPVDKIVGPGNAYVAAAKRQLFGRVGIDSIAGPSEILVIADKDNDPSWIAADLLSQAEHDPVAQAILITDDAAFADAVTVAVQTHLQTLPRSEIARQSWQEHGAIILTPDLDSAVPLAERIAPEHLELAVADPDRLAAHIHAAGAIFLGCYTPEAIGDYVAGSNHVLPTARTARFSSGLSVYDFLKRTALIGCDHAALAAIGPAAITLAQAEGLEAHALSVRIRLPKSEKNC